MERRRAGRGGSRPVSPVTLDTAPLRDASYVAGRLGIPQKTVLQYARDGRLPSVRIGKHVRFVSADLDEAIARLRDARG